MVKKEGEDAMAAILAEAREGESWSGKFVCNILRDGRMAMGRVPVDQ